MLNDLDELADGPWAAFEYTRSDTANGYAMQEALLALREMLAKRTDEPAAIVVRVKMRPAADTHPQPRAVLA